MCPGPTEGRIGGTDSGFDFFNPNTSAEIWNDPSVEGIVMCPMSPNFTTCDGWEYHGMDGAKPVYKRPKEAPDGNFTMTCTADTGVVYTIAVGPTDPADRYHRAFGGCEEAIGVCGAVDDGGDEDGVELQNNSRIVENNGGGGVILRDGARTPDAAIELEDLYMKFKVQYGVAENEAPVEEPPEGEGEEGEEAAAEPIVIQYQQLVEITFKGDTEVDLSFDYTNFSIEGAVLDPEGGILYIIDDVYGVAEDPEAEEPQVPAIKNIVLEDSKILFDIVAASGVEIEVTLKGLGVYITDGHAKDSEELKITFNEVDYFGDNFYIDTFSEYCDGIGRFIGSTGLNGTFKIGDSLTYIPLAPHNGQEYYLDLSQLDIPGLTPLGEQVVIAEGNLDKIDTTFPLIEERRETGEYLYTCMTSPISVDNEKTVFGTDLGSFSGMTGANDTYRIGDNLVYHGPYPQDEDTYTLDMERLGKTKTELSETEIEILESSNIDDGALALQVKATDNAGNEVEFTAPTISVDTIRPIFTASDFLTKGIFLEWFIPQSKLDDVRYKGFEEKYGKVKSIWGDGDHVKVLMPEDDTTDEGDPLVSVDFTDISSAGNLTYANKATDLEIELDKYYDQVYTNVAEIAGYIDQTDYAKVIKYTDDAGNESDLGNDADGNTITELKTKEVSVDMVGPQIPVGPPSYTMFEILVNKLIAIIGDGIKLKVPTQDVRSEDIRFSSNLSNLGGTPADYMFEAGEQTFMISAGEIDAGEDYDRVIYYFDKAFNLIEREIDKIFIDNKVSTFDTKCGGTFTLTDRNTNMGDFNQIADVTNDENDILVFKSPDNSIDGCNLVTFSIDFTPISAKKDLVDSYSRIPADGRLITIEVGEGTLDDTTKQLVLKVHDAYGNTKDYLTGVLNIDNELTSRQMLDDKITFADFDTEEETMYIGLGDDIKIELKISEMEDITSVVVKIDGGMNEYELTQDARSQDDIINNIPNTNPWRGVTGVSAGNYQVEPKYITYIIIDDAGNRVELEGNQKIYISNKVPDVGGADGGTEDLHRDGFSGGRPLQGRGNFLRDKERLDSEKIKEYMSEAEKFEKRIKFLKKHGFELGPEELAYMKARSLNRRLNYLEPKVNTNHKKEVPSYWELLKEDFRVSRKRVISKQKEPRKFEKKIRALVDPKKQVKNWNKLVDREGGLHTQNTLDNLKSSARKWKPKFSKPGTLRKTELYQRGLIGTIK